MKAIAIVKYLFTLVGVAMLAGAFFVYNSTSSFLKEAATAEGIVVELLVSRTSDSISYRPLVEFTAQNGQVIEFAPTAGSNPARYAQGEQVEVLYQVARPSDAKINDFFSLWGVALILAGMGAVFFLVGAGIIVFIALKGRQDDMLKTSGVAIETQYQSVEQNTALSVNGKHPFRVLTQWQNPATSDIHIFKSNNLWFDPSAYIKQDTIRVFIARGNPAKYYVDLSFLPKLK
ncbi:Protein of unknown function [Rheinheimera pacifica]|uniref:DUF3592 domain-containing protein n=1 Tax=Rheinheimera pacifica TaxID=173990 RepID=A0A1H6KH55_9GAMM|nr:DUF3592 domain-containing protein [Rheinheimera pacifica]SEH70836.1 Protein of unknown function [Rheinheimera pacifica]